MDSCHLGTLIGKSQKPETVVFGFVWLLDLFGLWFCHVRGNVSGAFFHLCKTDKTKPNKAHKIPETLASPK